MTNYSTLGTLSHLSQAIKAPHTVLLLLLVLHFPLIFISLYFPFFLLYLTLIPQRLIIFLSLASFIYRSYGKTEIFFGKCAQLFSCVDETQQKKFCLKRRKILLDHIVAYVKIFEWNMCVEIWNCLFLSRVIIQSGRFSFSLISLEYCFWKIVQM